VGLNDKSYSFVVQMGLINFTLTPIIYVSAWEKEEKRLKKKKHPKKKGQKSLQSIQTTPAN